MKTSNKGSKKAADNQKASDATAEILEIPAAKKKVTAKAKPLTGRSVSTPRKQVIAKAASVEKVSGTVTKATVRKRTAKTQSATTSPVRKAEIAAPTPAIAVEKEPVLTEETGLAADPLAAMSPIEKLLAQPTLPRLEREDRARLLMQTPTRLYFYWSVRQNPWALLRKAFGDDIGSYTLVLKLVETRSGTEQIYNADAEGNWWFDVRPDSQYQAEIGFYAPNRPYFRIVYSNTVETPRLKPSPRKATEAKWTVTADKFAQVLDVAGFSKDAFDVAIAGDDIPVAGAATRRAFQQFVGGSGEMAGTIDDEDIRYAMLELAAGQKLDDLRWKISAELFARLQASDKPLGAERAQDALREHFDIDDLDFESEEIGPEVFGASLVNFPRRLKTRAVSTKHEPRYAPISSHSLR